MTVSHDPRYIEDPPEWVWNIIDKHDLAHRTDCPLAAATVLMHEAADRLREASLTTHREQAVTADTKRGVAECAEMIADAQRLYTLCPSHSIKDCSSVSKL